MKLSEIKKQQIIQAATAEFRKQGFQGCSMDQIAQRAEVSKRTVYNHFASKETLFISVLEQLVNSGHEVLSWSYDPSVSIEDQLLEIARIEVELLQSAEVQQFSRILLGELVHSTEMVKMFEKQRPSCQEDFTIWLKAAIADKVLAIDDVPFAVEQFFGLIKTSALWPTLLRQHILSDAEKQQIILATVTMFLNTYTLK